jgi:hypothetical protein
VLIRVEIIGFGWRLNIRERTQGRAHIRGLADIAGTLPIWSRWFDDDPVRASLVGIDALRRDALAFAEFTDIDPE